MAQAAASICEICTGGPGEHYCQQCDQLFCRNCKLSHLRAKISKNHTFVSGPNINKEEKLLCTEHEEMFLFYCHDCDTPVCRICSVKKHSRHLMTDLTESTLKLKSEISKEIELKIIKSRSNLSKIEKETQDCREEVKIVIKSITSAGIFLKQLIDKKVEALIKLVQDKEQKEMQIMTAYREKYKERVEKCETLQKKINTMETTANVLLFKKFKQLKTDCDQLVLEPIHSAPSVSYRNKQLSSKEIDNLFGELEFRMREVSHHYVAAIDIGTTYSGFAFSASSEQASIYTSDWKDSDLTSSKTPTSVLLNKQQKFVAFGYKADNKYIQDIIPDEKMDDFYYFRRFKMSLLNKKLTMDTEIEEECGKKMKALNVFVHAIMYLKEQVIIKIHSRFVGATEDNVRFVLTVPSIWSDQAKFFMRKAAEKAGIGTDQLTIALEPVAASIYCQELRLDVDKKENKFLQIKSGMKFMVIDLGGGTADITVYQCQKDVSLEEVLPPSGGPWGGTAVDESFLNFMKDLFGADVIDGLKEEDLEDYFHLLHDFEIRKRSVKSKGDDDRDIVIQMSVTLMDLIKKLRGGISSHIKKSKYKDFVSVEVQRLHIKADIFRNLFKSTTYQLIKHLNEMFEKPELSDLKHVIMVGGFSECELVQMAVRVEFGADLKIIIPDEAGLAVLKGAVLFGHQKKTIPR